MTRPAVSLLAMGGTIATTPSADGARTGRGAAELAAPLAQLPDLAAEVRPVDVRTVPSRSVTPTDMWDLADAVRSGRIPDLQALREYDDDDVVTALTAVRGIGRWTAEMQLIFLLDRPDVFPVADVGIRRGFERVLGLDVKATPAQMIERSQDWAPYRSVASWYLWRAVDQTGQSVPPA